MKRKTTQRSPWIAFVVFIDAVLILFPPIYWGMASGSMALALTYVIGVPTIVALSVVLLDKNTKSEVTGNEQ